MQSSGPKCLAKDVSLSTYGKAVLVGNWSERRYGADEKSNAILPGIRVDGCEFHRTLYKDSFTDADFVSVETNRFFDEQRKSAFRTYLKSRQSSLNFPDHESLMRNYTTTKTLDYDELPRLRALHLCKNYGKSGPPQKHAEVDRLQAFGNLTKTHNYRKRHKCEKILSELSYMQTTYSATFNRTWKKQPILEFGPDYDGVVKFDLTC
ncbi:hypothetical protein KR009_007959 [Drosophila setifemur]|nr:hypothetical protein KR009_007959 [Drosophila setifemur]